MLATILALHAQIMDRFNALLVLQDKIGMILPLGYNPVHVKFNIMIIMYYFVLPVIIHATHARDQQTVIV